MKILLVTDAPPNKEYSGALLTDALCRQLPTGCISCYAIVDKGLEKKEIADDLGICIHYDTKPIESWHRLPKLPGFVQDLVCYIRQLYLEKVEVKKIFHRLLAFANDQKVDRIWCILQGQTLIHLAARLCRGKKWPVMIQVWDHVDWWLGHRGIEKTAAKRIRKIYEWVIKSCASFGGASNEMVARVKTEVPHAFPLLSAYSHLETGVDKKKQVKKAEILIGFSGQLYADAAFKIFFETLDMLNWKYQYRKIRLLVFGHTLSVSKRGACDIEYLGYRSQSEVIAILRECDYLLCPYIFEERYRTVAETSFPAKLATYMSTGVPVLFFGPSYSAPFIFLKHHNAAFLFPSDKISLQECKEQLVQALEREEEYQTISLNSREAFIKHLHTNVQKENFIRFITADGCFS